MYRPVGVSNVGPRRGWSALITCHSERLVEANSRARRHHFSIVALHSQYLRNKKY